MKTDDFILEGQKSKLTIKIGTENIFYPLLYYSLMISYWLCKIIRTPGGNSIMNTTKKNKRTKNINFQFEVTSFFLPQP
jgi:hypothetical protein